MDTIDSASAITPAVLSRPPEKENPRVSPNWMTSDWGASSMVSQDPIMLRKPSGPPPDSGRIALTHRTRATMLSIRKIVDTRSV